MTTAPKKVTASVHTALKIRYKTSVINPDGSVAYTRPWKNNLILDQGLNLIPTIQSCDLFRAAVVGTGNTPVKRDSGSVTMSRAGTTVTASAPFFGSGDVGRLLKFDSGEEVYITVFTNTTTVSTSTSGTIAASEGTIWYVNQTGLDVEVKRTQTCRTEVGDNFTTFDGVDTFTHQRTFQFTAESGAITYQEIGWSYTASAVGGSLCGRDVIPGGGDALTTGQQYQVVVQMTVSFSPLTQQAVASVGTGINTAGTFMMESRNGILSSIDVNGGTSGTNGSPIEVQDNYNRVRSRVRMTDWSQQTTVQAGAVDPGGTWAEKGLAVTGYVSGSFQLDYAGTHTVAEANGTIYGISFHSDNGFGGASGPIITSLHFTTPHTKVNTHSLSFTYRKSWGRQLVN